MDKEKLKEYLTFVQTNIVENKTNQLILLGVSALFIVILSISILFFVSRFSKTEPTLPSKLIITPIPTKPTVSRSTTEKILSSSWNLNCQVVVVTTEQKRFLRRFKSCKQQLQYIISPTAKYLSYVYQENNNLQLYVYSLENNIEAVIDQPILNLLDFKFTTEDNLVVLLDQKQLSYYMIPYLYSAYPNNFNSSTGEFTDLSQKMTNISLPLFSTRYSSIKEENGQIILLDNQNKIIYTLLLKDLNEKIIPAAKKNPRINYDWNKRVLYVSKDSLKSINTEGDDEEIHSVVCEGNKVNLVEMSNRPYARSPDGKTLVFVLSSGSIAIFDLVKDVCEVTGLTQTNDFHENMAFSPSGEYLAYVNKGLHIYVLSKKQDNAVLEYSIESFERPLAITGPLLWSSDNKFICMSVSKVEGNVEEKQFRISDTELTRVYFNDMFQGREQSILSLQHISLPYVCSPDGEKAIYSTGTSIYKYTIQNKQNSLFKSDPLTNPDFKMIWLRSGKIVSNKWIADESMQFDDISLGADFSIDNSGTTAAYTGGSGSENLIIFYDLEKRKIKETKYGKKIEGKLLIFNNK